MEFSDNLKAEILKKLTHKSPRPPTRRTCRSRLEFASSILSAIGSSPTPDTVALAVEIAKKAQTYLGNATFPVLDKLILRIANKVFSPELVGYVRGEDDEIVAGVCYVKYKHLGIIDERLFRVCGGLKGEIKRKIEQLLVRINGKADSPAVRSTFRRPAGIFPVIKAVPLDWSDFTQWGARDPALRQARALIGRGRLKDARALLLSLVNSGLRLKAMAYNLLAYVHTLLLEFQECVFYLDLLLEITSGSDWVFALHCLLCVERLAGFPSLSPMVYILPDTTPGCATAGVKHTGENKLLMRQQLGTSFERICLFSRASSAPERLLALARDAPGLGVLFIFSSDDVLFIYNALCPSVVVQVPWSGLVSRFDEIMHQNHLVLATGASTPEEKHHWWDTRIKLDRQLGDLISELSGIAPQLRLSASTRLLLILEDSVAFFPFESVFNLPAVRILSQEFSLSSSSSISSVFYLLDPSNNLKSTRDTIFEYFSTKNFDQNFLRGVVGRSLSPNEVALLSKSELFMYFGHGTGKRHFDVPDSRPAALFLFGCSSSRLIHVPNFKANGFCLRHMKGGRTLLGNLWDVTDKDLDRLTIAFLNDFFDGKDILEAIHDNRGVCKLKYLNSSALVVYGCSQDVFQ